jgi:hypothetical protein
MLNSFSMFQVVWRCFYLLRSVFNAVLIHVLFLSSSHLSLRKAIGLAYKSDVGGSCNMCWDWPSHLLQSNPVRYFKLFQNEHLNVLVI